MKMRKMKLNVANCGLVSSSNQVVGISCTKKSIPEFPKTLLELEQPETLVFYNYFNLEKTHFLPEEKSVLLEIKASFLEELASLDMKVTFVEKESKQVIGEVACDTVTNIINHTESLLVDVADICDALEENATKENATKEDATKEILVILEAVFHHAEDNTTELQVTKQVNAWVPSELTLDPSYQHFHPAKQSSCIYFPDDELAKTKNDYIETQYDELRDDQCIVIALYREPSDITQCDYICLYGHTPVGGIDTPYIGLPSKGIVSLGRGVDINEDASFDFQAMIQRVDQGGVAVTTTDFVTPIISDGSFQYEIETNWNQTIPQTGSWVPVTYNYNLSFQIQYTLPGSSIERIYSVVIGSDVETSQTSGGLVYNIPQIQFMWGCLSKGTLVRMFDQTEKRIEDIVIGDNVMGRNMECVPVVNVWQGMEESIYRISTDVGEISMTHHHPVMVNNRGVLVKKIASQLEVDDQLIDYHGSDTSVRDIAVVPYNDMVYNLSLDIDQPYFIANGIVVGDMTIQNS